jgi:hypothetical protein
VAPLCVATEEYHLPDRAFNLKLIVEGSGDCPGHGLKAAYGRRGRAGFIGVLWRTWCLIGIKAKGRHHIDAGLSFEASQIWAAIRLPGDPDRRRADNR